jgi:cysteine desulfurase
MGLYKAKRGYLDYNATTPLNGKAREAMIDAMNIFGNPSSIHAEGRAAKAAIEKARGQVALALGADGADIVFTASATEAAALACAGRGLSCSPIEHEAIAAWCVPLLATSKQGQVSVPTSETVALQLANSETGIVQHLPKGLAVVDLTQAFGKMPLSFHLLGCKMAIVSAHKLGGPKGVGALILERGLEVSAQMRGGGQEMGRRAGTENILGIIGFGAAAEVAAKLLADGVWDKITQFRNILEIALSDTALGTISISRGIERLPNTLCIASPGWKGETQVMQMDLAGFAVSAGSACSSGKVLASLVLRAMGYDDNVARSAIRISLGPDTRTEDVLRFADAFLAQAEKQKRKI